MTPIPLDGSLVKPSWSKPAARIATLSAAEERVRAGDLSVIVSLRASAPNDASGAATAPLIIRIEAADGRVVQQLRIDAATGFTNSGWNVTNGTLSFNRTIFTDPKGLIDELHAQHFRVVLHSVILTRVLRGTVHDRCDLSRYDEEEAGCYWNTHRKTFALGVDGWWPDEGDCRAWRMVDGTTTGPTRCSTAARSSIERSISRRCRSTCVRARSSRWDRSSSTEMNESPAR